MGVSGSYGVSEYGLDLLPGVGEDTVSDELVPVKRLFYPTNATGTHFDPSDLSTIYQDAAGTTPGAVGSVVGLMLDKSQGLVLGSELVTNGGFDTDLTGWTNTGGATATQTAGVMRVTAGGSTGGRYQDVAMPSQKFATITLRARKVSGTSTTKIGIWSYGAFTSERAQITVTSSEWTEYEFNIAKDTSGVRVYVNATLGDGVIEVDNISVRELPGYHASQSSAGSKPLERQTADGKYYVDYDGVDDYMTTTTGGGGTAGFFYCAAIRVDATTGSGQILCSDAGSNTGYTVQLNSALNAVLFAGYGTSNTGIVYASPLTVGSTYVITAWDDGINLNLQVNNGTVAQTARPVVLAGTAAITIGKANWAATGYFNGGIFNMVYVKNGNAVTASQREQTKRWVASRAGVTL